MIDTHKSIDDRRRSPRVDYTKPVDLLLDGRLIKETSSNISDTGIFIASRRPDKYEVHDKLTISFISDSKPVKRIGWVVRKAHNGVGVVYIGEIVT